MCGIAGGVWDSPGRRVSLPVLNRMTDILRHRGPDGRGTYLREYDDGAGCALGHRRLAIIDLEGGQQPLANEDETVWVTFNGEIYNYRELACQLQQSGHVLKTCS